MFIDRYFIKLKSSFLLDQHAEPSNSCASSKKQHQGMPPTYHSDSEQTIPHSLSIICHMIKRGTGTTILKCSMEEA